MERCVGSVLFRKRTVKAASDLFYARSLDSFSKNVAILQSSNKGHCIKPVRSFTVSYHPKNTAQKDLKCAEDAEQRINARGDFINYGVTEKCFTYQPRCAVNFFPYWCNTSDDGVIRETIYDGCDVIVQTRIGSEKMKFYVIPLVEKMLKEHVPNSKNPRMLVLTPTSELADLVAGIIRSHSCELKVIPMNEMTGYFNEGWKIHQFKKGVDIVVGTPEDIAWNVVFNFSDIDHVVLHEVDRMINMGFTHYIDDILSFKYRADRMKENPQTLIFTATLPSWVCNMTKEYLYPYVSLKGLDDLAKNCVYGHIDRFNFENVFFKEDIKDLRNFLENVSESNKAKFDELAKELMEKSDPVNILATALAVAAGYEQKSLIDFSPGFVTLKFTSDLVVDYWRTARELMPEMLADKAKNIGICHDKKSFVFDVPMLLGNKYMESRKDDYDNDISFIDVLPSLSNDHYFHPF